MDFKNVVLDVENSFGEVRFKKIVNKIFKYVNGERTEEFIGYKILVESSTKKDVFEIKILDGNVDAYSKIAINQDDLYNQLIIFDELCFNVSFFKGKLYHNLSAYDFKVYQND